MWISNTSIKRPVFATMVILSFVVLGIVAMTRLGIDLFPSVDFPFVNIATVYPGASAQAVEESVAQVIEAQVNGVERMLYMKSISGGDGSYSLTVSFEVGSDPDLNTVNVTNRVNQALATLPGSLREAFVMKHVEGRSYEEMADLLGTTVGALKMRVHRAREALQALLEEKYA